MVKVEFGQSVGALSWEVVLGIVTLGDLRYSSLGPVLTKVHALSKTASGERIDGILSRIKAFEDYFEQNGWTCPLRRQFELVSSRPPSGSPLVQSLLLAETGTGLLMGAHNLAAIKGDLLCDLAQEHETYAGIRNNVRCRANEIVLRDEEGIIANLFQGPDRRTLMDKRTRDVIFFLFSAPTITFQEMWEATEMTKQMFQESAPHIGTQVLRARD